MKAVIDEVVSFRRNLHFLKSLMDTGHLRFRDDGIYVDEADAAMVGLVEMDLEGIFSEYEIDEEFDFGISFKDLYLIVKEANQGDMVQLKVVDSGDDSELEVYIEKENYSIRRNLPYKNLNDEQPDGDLDYPTGVRIDFKGFKEGLKQVADSVTFDVGSNFTVHSNFEEGEVWLDFFEAEIESYESENEAGKAMYSVDYLKKLKKFKASVDEVLITFAKDFPAQFNLEGEGFETRFILAPRIEEDE